MDESKKNECRELSDFAVVYGMPAKISYEQYVGMWLNKNRAFLQRSYMITLGMSEFYNDNDMDPDWIEAISENKYDEAELGFAINAGRWSARQKRDIL